MPLKPAAQRLETTLTQLARCETRRDRRQLAALGRELAEAAPFAAPILLPSGQAHPEAGCLLDETEERSVWLLATGRLLVVAPSSDAPVSELSPGDPSVDPVWLVGRLRWVALAIFLRGVPLSDIVGMEALVVLSDLLTVAWEVDRHGREAILRLILDAMPRAEHWGACAQRLKAGFERALVDSSPPVRAVATRGLVLLACGQVPGLSEREAARTLELLFSRPQTDVVLTTLDALAKQPRDVLERFEEVLRPLVHEALLSADPEVRHRAARLELSLPSTGVAGDIVRDLADDDPAVREAALAQVNSDDATAVEAVLPLVLDAAADQHAGVRGQALRVLVPLLAHEDARLRERVIVCLLESPDPTMVGVGIEQLLGRPTQTPEVLRAVRMAVDGPQATRARAVRVYSDLARALPSDECVEAYLALLRHSDSGVRMALLEALSAGESLPPDVADELRVPLVDHLQDPVPALRLEAARAILRQRSSDAAGLVMPLAIDPDPLVHRGIATVLREAGAAEAARIADVRAGHAETLLDIPAAATGDARVRWTASLDVLTQARLPGLPDFLASVLRAIPPDTTDAFPAFARDSLRERIVAACSDPMDLVRVCRRLLAPPDPSPVHAARLAGSVAADDPVALDFLWTLFTLSQGAVSEAARRELAAIGPATKSPSVKAWLEDTLGREADPARRDVLRTLLAGAGR